MRKILAVGVAALLGACSSEKPRGEIQWGAPRPSTTAEEAAVADSLLTLQNSLSYQASTQPDAGAAGLGDRLVADLDAATATSAQGAAYAKPTAGPTVRQEFDTTGMDPSCVVPSDLGGGVTKYTWTNCLVDVADPIMGITMQATIDGWLTWNPALGETAWWINNAFTMSMPFDQGTLTTSGTDVVDGKQTVTASTIVADTTSTAVVHAVMKTPSGSFASDETVTTRLSADLDYTPDPFCITGGKLTVVQQTAAAGAPPFQGFELTFTGASCSAFQLAHGS